MDNMGRSVVVVEDDEFILEFLELVFAAETMEVIRARDGIQGIEVVERYRPDAIVCDLHMAGMTGLDVLQRIRNNPAVANIPFVVMTADQDPALRQQCVERGADALVLKPFDPDLLVDTLKGLMRNRDRPPTGRRPARAKRTVSK